MKDMKVVLLAGGYGMRFSEYTEKMPKPMIEIGEKPILYHIMKSYAEDGFKNFIVALGYKGEYIKNYFLNYSCLNSDFTIDLLTGKLNAHSQEALDWKISLIHTGINTMTGGRLKRLEQYIGEETFLLTYGDGLADIDIKKLIDFHQSHKKMITVTAVKNNSGFGELKIEGDQVISFKEKPSDSQGWINGGFLVINKEIFQLLDGDDCILEKDVFEKIAKMNQMMVYRHNGFWQCMDNKKDYQILQNLWNTGQSPWSKKI